MNPNYIYQKLRDAFYSKVERLVEDKAPNRNINKDQLTKMLENNGAKKAELEWLNLDGYLEEHPKATKQELLDYIKKNNVKIDVVEFGDEYSKTAKEISKELGMDAHEIPTLRYLEEHSKDIISDRIRELYNKLDKIDRADTYGEDNNVRNDNYKAVKGGENYREIVLTMPNQIEPFNTSDKTHYGDVNGGTAIVWLRVDDRQTDLGKTLNIQEVQSKRAEVGRRKGYQQTPKFTKDANVADKVGDFPYKTAWHELALKHALHRAAVEGYDAISWVTGQQTADLYDLRKAYNAIRVRRDSKSDYTIVGELKDGSVHEIGQINKDKLEGAVGKSLADKIIAQKESYKKYEGLDLKIGGEWAKNLYDKTIVNYMNKFGKKFGAKVENITINKETVHALPITPEMRKSVLEGQPLFQRGYKITDKRAISQELKPIENITKPNLEETHIENNKKPESPLTEFENLGLRKSDSQEIRDAFEFDKVSKSVKEARASIINEVLKNNLQKDIDIVAREILENPKSLDRKYFVAMVLRAEELMKEINGLTDHSDVEDFNQSLSGKRLELLQSELDRLTEATELAGRENSRDFGMRQIRIKEDLSLASTFTKGKKFKGEKLNLEDKIILGNYVKKIEKLEKETNILREKYKNEKAEKEKILAERITNVEVKKAKRTKAKLETILNERKNIKNNLKALGFRVNDLIGLTSEGYYLVGKLVTNYIKEAAITTQGEANLNDVVKQVQKDLPDISKDDIYKSLNTKNPRLQVKAKTDVEMNIKFIKDQARLLDKIKKAEEGIFENKVKKTNIPESEIAKERLRKIRILQKRYTDLRRSAMLTITDGVKLAKAQKTIDKLQDQLDNHYRDIKKKRPIDSEELADLKKRANKLRKELRLEDTLIELKHQIETGEFKIKNEYKPDILPKDLNKKEIQIRILKRELRAKIRDLKPKTHKYYVKLIIDTARTAKATADLSGTLRQAAFAAARHPIKFSEYFYKSLGATIDPNQYETIQKNIENHPNFYLSQAAGLKISDIRGILGREEFQAGADILSQIPGYGKIVDAANRQMTTMLNLTRFGMFNEFLKLYPNATMHELQYWSSYVNIATGVGDFGKFPQVAELLGPVVFAPKFSWSRIQYPFQLFDKWSEPRVRKEIAKEYVANIALATLILGVAKLAGVKVGTNPEDSDFGKIVIGKTRIDIFAGLQQPLRVGIRILDIIGGKTTNNPLDLMYRFSVYKLAPSVTIPLQLIRGKSIVGEKTTALETLAGTVVPFVLGDTYDAYRLGNIGNAAWVMPLSLLGVGVNTYKRRNKTEEFPKIKEQIKKVKELREKALNNRDRKIIIEYKREKRKLKVMEEHNPKYQLQKLKNRISTTQRNRILK